MKRRRGYALIEMVIVISALAVIFALCVGLIHSMLRLDRISRNHLKEAMTVDRLARQFRRDAHAAKEWKTVANKAAVLDRLELTYPDGRLVHYQIQKGKLERLERVGDRTERFEFYSLTLRENPTFRIQDSAGSTLALLALPRQTVEKRPREQSTIQIQAVLGKDQRVGHAEKGAK